MDRKNTVWVGVVVGAALLAFGFVFFRSKTVDTKPAPATAVIGTTTTGGPADIAQTIITAKHAFRGGEHLLAGEIALPTPCHLLEQTVTILPDQSRATVAFTRNFQGGECPGGEVAAKFLVRFKGKPDTALHATIDGRDVTLSLIEAGPNEDIEHTQIYIKG